MKRIFILLVTATLCLTGCGQIQDDIESVDKEVIVENFNLTADQIIEEDISELKRKYKEEYTIEFQETIFDSKDIPILLGMCQQIEWAQRSLITFQQYASFKFPKHVQDLINEGGCSIYVGSSIVSDGSRSNNIGVFAKVQTNRYLMTKKDKETNEVLELIYEDRMTIVERIYQPVYNSSDGLLEVKINDEWVKVKTFNGVVPSSMNDLRSVERSWF